MNKKEAYADVVFPLRGIDTSCELDRQPAQTTPLASNVRANEPGQLRQRGGQRPGLSRYVPVQVDGGAHLVQHLNVLVDPTTPALLDEYDSPDDDAVVDPSGLGFGGFARGLGRRIRNGGSGIQSNRNRHKTPLIAWSNPADITQGTALSGTQLNAAATDPTTGDPVAGTFTYSPPSGTVLPEGDGQTLSADFAPTDTATYRAPPQKHVSINVTANTNIAFVQANSAPFTVSSPGDVAFNADVTAGNLIVVATGRWGGVSSAEGAVTDSQGNTYTLIAKKVIGGSNALVALWWTTASSSGALTVTYTWSGTTSATVGVLEYSGVNAVPVDASATNSGTGTTESTGAVAVNGADELVLGAFAEANGASLTFVPTAGQTLRVDEQDGGVVDDAVSLFVAELLPTSSAGTISGTVAATFGWSAVGASFAKA